MFFDKKIITGIKFHHFGLAVKYPEKVRTYLQFIGYNSLKPEVNKFNVYIQFHEHVLMPRIELVYKCKDSTPIDNILKTNDTQIYRTCFQCIDTLKIISQLKNEGFKLICVSKRTGDFPFSFYYIKGIGLIEFYENPF